ncbi:hypothetical protein C8A05DRAFT_13258 [Staphylotrichum tortipilum]|uniref:Nephrocystin 3-like N-terminal domain-containing protein n=1 Tax=Staphylotrichum tortipilum TaxID=2831512 RepID=A0AAN6MSF5_9PEZI|nr:hypothetical protein C8A05DRAFT_13258 [Staphylotrichum longicolle]
MDPVSAIGLASGILSFITFSTSLIQGAIHICDSLDGQSDENRCREAIANDMKSLATRMFPPDDSRLSGEEKGLCLLASECRDLSDKLVNLLGRIKAKDPQSKRQSLWSALKNKVSEKEKVDLEQRLDHCRSQLTLQLAFLNKHSISALVKSAESHAANVKQLCDNIEHLRQGVQVASFGPEAQEHIRHMVSVQGKALSTIVQNRIVKGLEFEGMHDRFDMVDEAHYKTFRWIFEVEDEDATSKPTAGVRVEERRGVNQRANETFTTWLSSGEGLFHISGKPGSGKSTLMKYLGDHDGTHTNLTKWADGRNLVVAKFFFWRPGSRKQKSLDGLYQSLLHSVLKQRPDLISEIMPELWKEAREAPWQIQTNLSIPTKDIRAAFDHLIDITSLDANHCFCFFIDGLDEYQGTAQNDTKEMVKLLVRWTKVAPRHILPQRLLPAREPLALDPIVGRDATNL